MRDLPPDPGPTQAFPFEPDAARALTWLPLAVRYKLDRCALRVSLQAWQALPLRSRERLLACPAGDAFHGLALALFEGACRRDPTPTDPGPFRDYLARRCGASADAPGSRG